MMMPSKMVFSEKLIVASRGATWRIRIVGLSLDRLTWARVVANATSNVKYPYDRFAGTVSFLHGSVAAR